MIKKIVFLDFDGVLNSVRFDATPEAKASFIDKTRLPLLKRLLDETGAAIVLSTTWRSHWSKNEDERDKVGEQIDEIFAEYGMQIYDKTPEIDAACRGKEVHAWLLAHPEAEDFVILDDTVWGWCFTWEENGERKDISFTDHLVKTSALIKRGLESEHIDRAIALLKEG